MKLQEILKELDQDSYSYLTSNAKRVELTRSNCEPIGHYSLRADTGTTLDIYIPPFEYKLKVVSV